MFTELSHRIVSEEKEKIYLYCLCLNFFIPSYRWTELGQRTQNKEDPGQAGQLIVNCFY